MSNEITPEELERMEMVCNAATPGQVKGVNDVLFDEEQDTYVAYGLEDEGDRDYAECAWNNLPRLIAAYRDALARIAELEKPAEELMPLAEELQRARAKFPDSRLMLAAMIEEVGEVGNAIIEGKDWRAEALQVACTAMRLRSEGDAEYGLPAITESELEAQAAEPDPDKLAAAELLETWCSPHVIADNHFLIARLRGEGHE